MEQQPFVEQDERAGYRYTTTLATAQIRPDNGKPFFAFATTKVLWLDYEAGLHHKVVRAAMVEHGCKAEPMVFCDTEDMPPFLKLALGSLQIDAEPRLVALDILPHHYEQASN